MKSNKIATLVLHSGNEPDKKTGAIIPPIFQTSTYVQKSPGKHSGFEYTRSHNPTRTRLEELLADLEGGKYCVTTSSGMSSISLILESLPEGSSILCGNDVYGGTYRLLTTVYNKKFKINFCETSSKKDISDALAKFSPDLVWLESPTNPLLKISDIKYISSKKGNALLVVDNTFMSPYFQRPLELGADIVVHSMTKYINGHSDVVGGCIITNLKKTYDKIWTLHNSIGPCASPFDSWLIIRGIKTLAVRMEQHQKNALKIAKWLESHKLVEKVIYPGLKSHPQHKLAKKQMSGFGGMISVYFKFNLSKTKKFLSSVKLFSLAESLGGVESLIEHPAIMTHASIPKKEREVLGISDSFVRLSIGIEDVDDLINDLERSLKL